ncbi:MAG TPA: calcium-binding protein [Actinomycetota bacterium]|nr:calcium-binding protein [Actinomycetota bacterium]
MRRASRSLAGLAVLLLAMVGLATPAAAAVDCTFAAPTATVTADAGDPVTIVRSGEAIHVNGTACDNATVANTDTLDFQTTGVLASVTIDLSGGPFAPGATAESDDSSEIEINLPADVPVIRVLGSSGADHVTAGATGINLNANETTADVDVAITGTPSIELDGADGDDVLSIGGGAGMGVAVRGTLRGGLANDTLTTGAPGSAIDGGDGTDTVDYSGAAALEEANLATGQVIHAAGGTDTLTSIESFIGSPGDDTIVGSEGDDTIDGGDGSDTIDYSGAAGAVVVDLARRSATGQGTDVLRNIENVIGSDHNDTVSGDDGANVLDGGAGDDTVSFRSSSSGVTVNLKQGTAEGAGDDTLIGFEHVQGSPEADEITGDGRANRLEGLAGNDTVFGKAGDDRIIGGNGNDRLLGQGGDDVLRGEHGRDQHNGGRGRDHCKGGPGPDSFVLCENFPT